MNWKVLVYVLLWVFCWPVALYFTLDFLVFAIKKATTGVANGNAQLLDNE